MLRFHLTIDVLGNTRFAFSPLAEVAASLRLLGEPHAAHLHQPWLHEVRHRLAGVDIDLLLACSPSGRWAPSFFYPLATSPHTRLETQLETLSTTSSEVLTEELTRVWEGRPLPRRLTELLKAGPRAASILAECVWDYWDAAVAPYWPRICGVLEDDVSYRAGMALRGGLFDLLSDLHPEVSLPGDRDTLLIDKPHHAESTYEGAVLTLVPSVFVWPRLIVGHSAPEAFELTYAARGVGRVWEDVKGQIATDDTSRVGALLGRTRARILSMVETPMSTTQTAHILGQAPATVNQHLTLLRDCGMVTSWRSGRSVLYRRTALGSSVVAVDHASPRIHAADP